MAFGRLFGTNTLALIYNEVAEITRWSSFRIPLYIISSSLFYNYNGACIRILGSNLFIVLENQESLLRNQR